jgi:Arc/MetJ-type ribon-helix-helix transcriptional regulator
MKTVTVKLPESYVEGLEVLIRLGVFASKSEAIRHAVRELLRRELWEPRPFRRRGRRHRFEIDDIDADTLAMFLNKLREEGGHQLAGID